MYIYLARPARQETEQVGKTSLYSDLPRQPCVAMAVTLQILFERCILGTRGLCGKSVLDSVTPFALGTQHQFYSHGSGRCVGSAQTRPIAT